MHDKECGRGYYYSFQDGKSLVTSIDGSITKLKTNVGTWRKGMTVTVLLDCDEWKMSFWLNGNKMGTISIEKSKVYYPSMCFCGCGSDYELLSS